jgi:hypothetical protein
VFCHVGFYFAGGGAERRRPLYFNKETNIFWVPVIIVCGLFVVFLAWAPITRAGKMAIIACVPVGGILGFALGMVVACGMFEIGGNLCGLVAVFITGPVGSIAGGVTGWFIFRRHFATP